jgi:hypothetical protein
MVHLKDLLDASKEITKWLEWDLRVIDDAHRYCHRFHAGQASANVYTTILEDALRAHGLTLEQFRANEINS